MVTHYLIYTMGACCKIELVLQESVFIYNLSVELDHTVFDLFYIYFHLC